jgi:subtilisin family serine protease
VYVIDSGINSAHDEFVGRLGNGFNAVGNNQTHPGSWEDCGGHGTHVAGTIGGKQYGVAKNANIILHAVRTFTCEGWAFSSDILEAYEWVFDQCTTNTGRIRVANGSFSAGSSTFEAANAMVDAGIVYVVSAGNWGENRDATIATRCNRSPAEGVITVGSTTIDDHRSAFSNYGECVIIFAPVRTKLNIFWTEIVSILFLNA